MTDIERFLSKVIDYIRDIFFLSQTPVTSIKIITLQPHGISILNDLHDQVVAYSLTEMLLSECIRDYQ